MAMKKELKSSISLGVIFNYLRIFLFLVLSLLYPPFLLSKIGPEDNGILNFAISLIQIVTLLSLGSENSYIRFATKREKEEGEEGLNKINGSYLLLFTFVSLSILIVGYLLSLLYGFGYLHIKDVSEEKNSLVLIIIFIASLSGAIDFFFSYFLFYFLYKKRFVLEQIILITIKVLSILLSSICLFIGWGAIYVILASLIASLLVGLVSLFICFKKLNMKIKFASKEEIKGDLKEIFKFSIFIFLVIGVSQIQNNAGKVIISSFLGATSVTVFSYGLEFYIYAALLAKGVRDTFAPKINELYQFNSEEEMKETFLNSSFLLLTVLFICFGGFLLLGRSFLDFWLGKSSLNVTELDNIYFIGLISLAIWLIPLGESVAIEIERAANKHRFLALFNFVLALLSIPFSIFFIFILPNDLKIYAPLFGSGLLAIVGRIIVSNIYYKKQLSLPLMPFFKDVILLLFITSLSYLSCFYLYDFYLVSYLSKELLFVLKFFTFLLLFAFLYCLIYQKKIKTIFNNTKKKAIS